MMRGLPVLGGAAAGVAVLCFGWGTSTGTTDVDSAAGAAWMLLHRHTLALPAALRVHDETVRVGGSFFSDRPLGMILASVPGQLGAVAPSRFGVLVLAALLIAGTVAALIHLWGPLAWPAVLGTPFLFVAGRTLWPETIGLCCLALVLLARRQGKAWALLPLVLVATMCRLPFGLLLLGVVLLLEVGRPIRSRGAALAGFAGGLLALVIYSRFLFGSWSPLGGYPVAHHLTLSSLALGLFSPARGLLLWSPWLLLIRPVGRWRWVLVLAGCYVAGSWLLYDAWGGAGWVGYRYALPFAVLAAPSLRLPATRLGVLLLGWSVALGLLVEGLVPFVAARRDPWSSGVSVSLLLAALILAGLAAARYLPKKPLGVLTDEKRELVSQ